MLNHSTNIEPHVSDNSGARHRGCRLHALCTLEPIGGAGHHSGCEPHQLFRRHRQRHGAATFGITRMLGLVCLHPLNDCTAALVGHGQALQMVVKMRFNLTFGFGKKAEIGAIPCQAGERTKRE